MENKKLNKKGMVIFITYCYLNACVCSFVNNVQIYQTLYQ